MKSNDQEEKLFDEQHTGNIKGSNMIKDPQDWKTGDEPMTGAQHSYLETLSAEAGEEMDETLNKAQASQKIDELQHQTGRGVDDGGGK
ncbi:DUF3072 domain-containing protein [Mucilaginibacter ginkgonis]|uniref:DUF3072 domain-containing protein n=1 Tax=Mucilaginibacter ginkgonis TaxID=2682091 RepID=A0A6I4I5S7_9SPHI|nr:DUF3072 domain-containing protein [Mucilaginibacter ginkgonis]QQL49055.1 DUF3072 domain-containing protein [Mucilaginibacter ginkgonis]